jgi:hypothetical protein
VLIPDAPVSFTIKSETYPFRALGRNAKGDIEGTDVYITFEALAVPTATPIRADQWIARHAGPKSKFELLSRAAVESSAIPPVLDNQGKVFSPPYTLVFESNGAEDYPGTMGDHSYSRRNRQMFYFLPVSAQHIFTARVVRRVQYFEGFPQFEEQYDHFLATLKREAATHQSTLAGSKSRTRRFYTAYFSFEIFTRDERGGNQWLINKTSSSRTDVWHTPEGDLTVGISIISGWDFDPARENHKLKLDAEGLVKNLPGVVREMNPKAYVSKLKYIETPFADQKIYGHAEEDPPDRGGQILWELDAAYKTGKRISLRITGPATAMKAHEKDILAWLAGFKILN